MLTSSSVSLSEIPTNCCRRNCQGILDSSNWGIQEVPEKVQRTPGNWQKTPAKGKEHRVMNKRHQLKDKEYWPSIDLRDKK